MTVKIYASEILKDFTLIDLRTHSETMQVIEQAISLPLFSPTEILYIQKKGYADSTSKKLLTAATAKMEDFLERHPQVFKLLLMCDDGTWISRFAWDHIRLWREVFVFRHGVKGLRRWIRNTLQTPLHYVVLMGPTGVGKTEILQLCKALHKVQCIDFEGLARHKGSVFGNIRQQVQPSPLQFELSIAMAIQNMDIHRPVLVEYEPGNLGRVFIPPSLQESIQKGKTILLNRDIQSRIQDLVKQYAGQNDDKLKEGIVTLTPRLGTEKANSLLMALAVKDYDAVAAGLLAYYDQTRQYLPTKQADYAIHVTTSKAAAEKVSAILQGIGATQNL